MSEIAVAAAETQPGAPAVVQSAGSGEAGAKPARPEWLSEEKFWDGEAGKVNDQGIYQSYRELQSAFGKRIGDMSTDARRKLAEMVPDEMRATVAEETKAALAADEAFLQPLRDAWLAEKLPKAPDAYAPPEGMDLDVEHPAYLAAVELAKSHGMPQESFAKLVSMGTELLAPYEGEASFDHLIETLGKDLPERAKAIGNRVRSMIPDKAEALLRATRTPDAYLALEALVKSASDKPLVLEGAVNQQVVTAESLKRQMLDPKYSGPNKDMAFVRQIEAGWKSLYPSDRV